MGNYSAPSLESHQFVSLGAGVQATVMLLLADRGKLTPMPEAAIFADTGWESHPVYRHLDWLETEVKNVPIIRLNEGRNLYEESWNGRTKSGRADTIIPAYSVLPNRRPHLVASRECTREYKIRPIQREIAKLIGRPHGARSQVPAGVQWLGISTDDALRVKPSGKKMDHQPMAVAGSWLEPTGLR